MGKDELAYHVSITQTMASIKKLKYICEYSRDMVLALSKDHKVYDSVQLSTYRHPTHEKPSDFLVGIYELVNIRRFGNGRIDQAEMDYYVFPITSVYKSMDDLEPHKKLDLSEIMLKK